MSDGYYKLPTNYRETTCRSCGARVVFISLPSGTKQPLDLDTTEERSDGTYALTHFATCPQGRAWRRPEARQPMNNCIRYHGPTGDVNDPETIALVAGYQVLKKRLGLI